jgi:hypothetical protein
MLYALYLKCYMLYVKYRMSATVYLHLYVGS